MEGYIIFFIGISYERVIATCSPSFMFLSSIEDAGETFHVVEVGVRCACGCGAESDNP